MATRIITATADPKARIAAFLSAYRDAPDGTDIAFRIGTTDDGAPSILVSIGKDDFPFHATDAVELARVMEQSTHAGFDIDELGIPPLIDGLRRAAAAATKMYSS